MGNGGDGPLCFLQSSLSMLPGKPFFPFIGASGVEYKWLSTCSLNSSETSRANA